MASSYRFYITIICVMLCMTVCSLDACRRREKSKTCEKWFGKSQMGFADKQLVIFMNKLTCERNKCDRGKWIYIRTECRVRQVGIDRCIPVGDRYKSFICVRKSFADKPGVVYLKKVK
ncbi:hypothetical protein PoB_000535200 [Plakobranchus ocellatus]|uniref:Uncharacterized protein n=1 Tax=Plakobranchus ocellatus TaxID=259542 RepID=A0AAV3Y9R3_9GAST|nr:hypothetical protein PoB_000535200 [Plakobranchus ocellatus]